MTQCRHCGDESRFIIRALGYCVRCIRSHFDEIRPSIEEAHRKSREPYGLPTVVPDERGGVLCSFCVNQCRMGVGQRGFCGLRENRDGRLAHLSGTKNEGTVDWYHDPLPTNCVASWVCPAGTSTGYPEYSYSEGPEYGYTNLAVFYEACTFNCLFCQNYHFKKISFSSPKKTSEQLAQAVDERTACICYFGGDPTPQLPHAIAASREALKSNTERVLRICWETNGSMNRNLLKQMLELSLHSGGCIKFDLKAFEKNLHLALCGVSNGQTLENFRWLGGFTKERREPPLLVASTLLVPGYVDEEEVGKIARFVVSVDPAIPYSLLAFYPQFEMDDLPVTSRAQAEACRKEALQAGLERVHVGNIHLLIS
jgi:pyruvate formate lyase activating enzyme